MIIYMILKSKQTVDCLQNLVSSDGRFKNLRDAMHKCDPPLIPYLGMYLMDLVFIEESTPDTLDESLVNFAKLRMVSHIIRDIRTFQHSKYTIHYQKRVRIKFNINLNLQLVRQTLESCNSFYKIR